MGRKNHVISCDTTAVDNGRLVETPIAMLTSAARVSPRTNALTEVRVVRVTPFRFGRPEAGETGKILRRALSESITKAAPFRDW